MKQSTKIFFFFSLFLCSFSLIPHSLHAQHGVASVQGMRDHMEDRYKIIHDLGNGVSYYAVFDGHGGIQAAQYAADNLHKLIREDEAFPQNIGQATKNAIAKLDENFLATNQPSGTTAIVALVHNEILTIANVGDSRAVLCSNNKTQALSTDHKIATDEKEREKYLDLSAAKSRIDELARKDPTASEQDHFNKVFQGKLYIIKCNRFLYNHKSGRCLAMSRAIGDKDFKQFGLSSEPDITQHKITDQCQFIILASDGIWDTVSNEDAAEHVKYVLDTNGSPRNACETIVALAHASGSSDNITAVVVTLNS